MNELAMKSLKADIDQFTKEIRGLKEERKRMKMHIKQLERKNATLRQEHVSHESQLENERAKLEAWKSAEEKRRANDVFFNASGRSIKCRTGKIAKRLMF